MSHVGYGCLMAVDREHVLRSAAALLTRKSTATMDEVAKAAGISRATLHRQFAGRDALVRALEALGIAECEAALDAARLTEGPAREAVRRLVREVEPAAGLLAFLYSENQLFEGSSTRAGSGSTTASRPSSDAARRPASSVSTSPRPGSPRRCTACWPPVPGRSRKAAWPPRTSTS